jgi:hypothetical protein
MRFVVNVQASGFIGRDGFAADCQKRRYRRQLPQLEIHYLNYYYQHFARSYIPRFLGALIITMLSEKAKGKQRAVEYPAELDPEPVTSRDLVIRFTEGIPDLVLSVSQKDSIRDVKKNVRIHFDI